MPVGVVGSDDTPCDSAFATVHGQLAVVAVLTDKGAWWGGAILVEVEWHHGSVRGIKGTLGVHDIVGRRTHLVHLEGESGISLLLVPLSSEGSGIETGVPGNGWALANPEASLGGSGEKGSDSSLVGLHLSFFFKFYKN